MALDGTTRKVAAYVVDLALYSAAHESRTTYTMTWPGRWDGIRGSRDYPEQPHTADCSAFSTWLTWAARRHVRGQAGVDVINGQSWQAGYTGTMIEHGARHRSVSSTKLWHPGRTHVFYAASGTEPTHVAVFVGNVTLKAGTRWNGVILRNDLAVKDAVISHGRSAGPEAWPFNYRRIVQARAFPV